MYSILTGQATVYQARKGCKTQISPSCARMSQPLSYFRKGTVWLLPPIPTWNPKGAHHH